LRSNEQTQEGVWGTVGMRTIDLNSDMGESFGAYKLGLDEEVIKYVSSANIACGWHAGDARVMNRTVRLAKELGVGVGAHPGYPDLLGFGRRNMDCTADEIRDYVIYQVGALMGFCAANGVKMRHVKPHGALYNTAVENPNVAEAIVEAVVSADPSLMYVALAGAGGALMTRIGERVGLKVMYEAFADRAYTPDGRLVNRSEPGAVITNPEEVADRAVRMAKEGKVIAVDGTVLDLEVHTLCVHGDNPSAVELVKRIRTSLEAEGVAIQPMR
jgi:5-oxoprolinase (ATP-hydrolysing) subunit A